MKNKLQFDIADYAANYYEFCRNICKSGAMQTGRVGNRQFATPQSCRFMFVILKQFSAVPNKHQTCNRRNECNRYGKSLLVIEYFTE